MPYVRERPPGSGKWEAQVYTGRHPLTGKKRYNSFTIEAANKEAAKREANRIELEFRDGERDAGAGGTFGQLLDEFLEEAAVKKRYTPAGLKSARNIANAYLRHSRLADEAAEDIRAGTLDRFYRSLLLEGGRCRHHPCPRPGCGKADHADPCGRAKCLKDWTCPAHDGRCATWKPCNTSPCEHGAPLDVASVNRVHNLVRSVLEQGCVWGWYRHNHAKNANPGRVVFKEKELPEDPEIISIVAEAEEREYALATYIVTALESGTRKGATHAARWHRWSRPQCPKCRRPIQIIRDDNDAIQSFLCAACDALNGCLSEIGFPTVISIANKADGGMQEIPASGTKPSAHKVTLGTTATVMLATQYDIAFERALKAGVDLPKDAYIFSRDIQGRKPWRPEHTSRRFKQIARGLNLNDETQLRHLRDLMATKLLASGVNPKIVGTRGAWAKLATMLENYAAWLPAEDQEAAGVVDRIFNPNS